MQFHQSPLLSAVVLHLQSAHITNATITVCVRAKCDRHVRLGNHIPLLNMSTASSPWSTRHVHSTRLCVPHECNLTLHVRASIQECVHLHNQNLSLSPTQSHVTYLRPFPPFHVSDTGKHRTTFGCNDSLQPQAGHRVLCTGTCYLLFTLLFNIHGLLLLRAI